MRSTTDRKLAGICGGIGEYLDTDPTFVRLAWFLSVFIPPLFLAAILGYLVAWIVVPVAPHPAT